jgi:hypothetical protein
MMLKGRLRKREGAIDITLSRGVYNPPVISKWGRVAYRNQ